MSDGGVQRVRRFTLVRRKNVCLKRVHSPSLSLSSSFQLFSSHLIQEILSLIYEFDGGKNINSLSCQDCLQKSDGWDGWRENQPLLQTKPDFTFSLSLSSNFHLSFFLISFHVYWNFFISTMTIFQENGINIFNFLKSHHSSLDVVLSLSFSLSLSLSLSVSFPDLDHAESWLTTEANKMKVRRGKRK